MVFGRVYLFFWDLVFTCTRTVTRTPIITPTIGLFSRSEFLKKAARKGISSKHQLNKKKMTNIDSSPPKLLPPTILNESARKEREQMKK